MLPLTASATPSRELPPDIYSAIALHLPLSEQSNFRRVNKLAASSQFYENDCCRPPSNYEIATWLYNQSQLLSYENSKRYSIFNSNYRREPSKGPFPDYEGMYYVQKFKMCMNQNFTLNRK